MIADLQRQLGIDYSFFSELLLFLFLYAWLRNFLFLPFCELFLRRKKATEGLHKDAQQLNAAATRDEQERARRLASAKQSIAQSREKILANARGAAAQISLEARALAKKKIEGARAECATKDAAEFARLQGQVGSLADIFVSKLIGRGVGL